MFCLCCYVVICIYGYKVLLSSLSIFLLNTFPIFRSEYTCLLQYIQGEIRQKPAFLSGILLDELVYLMLWNTLDLPNYRWPEWGLNTLFWWFTWKAAELWIQMNVRFFDLPWCFCMLSWGSTKGIKKKTKNKKNLKRFDLYLWKVTEHKPPDSGLEHSFQYLSAIQLKQKTNKLNPPPLPQQLQNNQQMRI